MAAMMSCKQLTDWKFTDHEPVWFSGDIGNHPVTPVNGMTTTPPIQGWPGPTIVPSIPVQQSDLIKPLLMDIANYGLTYAYQKYRRGNESDHYKYKVINKQKKIIIIGAGMSGLVAAYELAQVGHEVQILETQDRVGGRIKTFDENDGFAKGLRSEGGAMRLPGAPSDKVKVHFLTDFYASNLFKLPLVSFNNEDDNCLLKFYNMPSMQIKEWKTDQDKNFGKLWPGWDAHIIETGAKQMFDIASIDDYFSCTTGVVTDQLRKRIARAESLKDQATVWEKWINNWNQFSLIAFLRSNIAGITALLVDEDYQEEICKSDLDKLVPWPDEAITAYSVYTYTEQLDQCLVQYLRDDLGQWWSPKMHTIDGGMSRLPEMFTKENRFGWNKAVHLQNNITFGVTVNDIEFTSPRNDHSQNHVLVRGYCTVSGEPFSAEGDAVIITAPLQVVRQIKIHAKHKTNTPEFPNEFYQAIEDIWHGPATKILLQFRTKFWEKDLGIKGGFSKTNLPIGQVHYPTSSSNGTSSKDGPGILICYTWKTEALLFGSLNPKIAMKEAVRQIAELHRNKDVEDEFEVGAIQAWYNDPAAQGAYALLKPKQYKNVRFLMSYPWENVYFAGDSISPASGWIQGALVSGLRAAYHFFSRNEDRGVVPS